LQSGEFYHLLKQLPLTQIRRADDTSGLTWGGQSYETQNGRVSGTEEVDALPISQGVYVQETEAVMLRFV